MITLLKSAFITAEFLVEKSGDQTVANKLEILSGSNGTQYVEDYKAIEGVQSSEKQLYSLLMLKALS